MNGILKLFLLACGVVFVGIMLYLLIKKKISEWNVMAWLSGAVVILLISARPEWFDLLAKQVGVSYPPSLLFLCSTLILLLLVLYQSIQLSALQNKVRQIAQHVAIQPHVAPPQQADALPDHQAMLAEVAAGEPSAPENTHP